LDLDTAMFVTFSECFLFSREKFSSFILILIGEIDFHLSKGENIIEKRRNTSPFYSWLKIEGRLEHLSGTNKEKSSRI